MKRIATETWIGLAVIIVAPIVLTLAVFIYLAKHPQRAHQHPSDVSSVPRAEPAPRWTTAVTQSRQAVRAAVLSQNLPAISVAVGTRGEIVWAEAFGVADLTTRAPATPDTRFRIGHVSKALTSAAVGLLVEKEQLGLDRDIQEYVPAYPEKAWPVSLRQLMSHTAGVIHYRDTEWGDKPSMHCARAEDGLQMFANEPLLFEPETKYQYSTYGWVLVSAAIEHVSGQPFDQFMRAHVFEPLQMSSTTADAPKAPLADRATSYFVDNFGRQVTTNVDYSCLAGGGALLSTPSDLVRFGAAMMSGALVKRDTVAKLQTRQTLRDGQHTQYGLGWMLDDITLHNTAEPELLASHASRTIEGASTSFLTFPARGLVVAVTANVSFADMRSIALAIARAFTS